MLITPDTIGDALDTAPGWAKVALTVPDARLREDATREMARHVYSALFQPADTSRDQLPLPL
jgi:hypothetical protein